MSLLHNIRQFAETELQGVIPWSKFSFPDEVKSDVANVSIEGKAGLYRVVVSSSYAVPPLGQVQFTDHATGHEISGDNQAGTWHRIAEYLKGREVGGDSDWAKAKEALLKRADVLASQMFPVVQVAPLPVNELPIPPVPMVWYISDPGVWYENGPALVTRINADGSYNLTIFPDGSDQIYRQNVRERSDGLRNVCWTAYRSASGKTREELQIIIDECMASMRSASVEMLKADPSDTAIDVNTEIACLKTAVSELTDTISRLKASAFDQRKSA
jgi:hypothetical protein